MSYNSIFNNNENISGLYIGDLEAEKVYVGDTLVYENSPTPIPNYLQFTAVNGAATISMTGNATPNVSYSFNGTNWTTWDYSNLTIPSGSTVYMKGNNPNGFNQSSNSRSSFTMSGTIEANGNVMSLLYEDNFEGQLTIPSSYCFYALFRDCTSLTSVPELPATTLTESCYESMFYRCSGLTAPPQLPATTITNYCYTSMFVGCTSLTSAPELLATTLANGCYNQMFSGCTSLTTAPVLPSTTLVNFCYSEMFRGCTSLNYIKAMFTTTPSTTYTFNWVRDVAASGTFVKNSAAQWDVSGNSGVPSGWTIEYYPPIQSYKARLTLTGGTTVDIPTNGSSTLTQGELRAYSATCVAAEITTAVTSIGEYAFSFHTNLTSATIPNTVTSIGNNAFAECRSSTSIAIPDSVISIGMYAFWGCSGLTNITIPNSVTSIGEYAFGYCASITSLTIPSNVEEIGGGVIIGSGVQELILYTTSFEGYPCNLTNDDNSFPTIIDGNSGSEIFVDWCSDCGDPCDEGSECYDPSQCEGGDEEPSEE